jgi:sugar lactone lactonase YvrE
VAVDAAGNLYIADAINNVARKVTPDGIITSVAGDAMNQTPGYAGDQGPATSALLRNPSGITVDAAGNLYIADTGNARVREVDTNGIITTVAGGGSSPGITHGDGGPATQAILGESRGVAVDASGNLYIADSELNNVRKVASDGTITTVAGCTASSAPTCGLSLGDGGPGINASIFNPPGVAVDGSGNLYIVDYIHNRIRKVVGDGTISTFAGSGTGSYSGDGGPAVSAGMYLPLGVAVDGSGNVFIADAGDHRIRMVTPDGTITTIAGNGTQGQPVQGEPLAGEGGPATSVALSQPRGLAVGPDGSVYFTDGVAVFRLTPQ